MKEIWKDVPGYEEKYEASNLGRIRSKLKNKKILKPKSGHRYQRVCLSPDFKDQYVHRIILSTFFGNPPTTIHQAAHLNGNTKDNRLKNLKWVTVGENHAHKRTHGTILVGSGHQNSKVTEKEVMEMRALFVPGKFGYIRLSKIFNLSSSTVRSIVLRKTWIHI